MSPIDRWFRDVEDMFGRGLSPFGEMSTAGMACDLHETDDAYLVSVDIPGIRKEDVDIDVSGNTLTVRGERKEEYGGENGGRSTYSERRYGMFERSFTLPKDVDPDRVEATCESGVLHVMVPKAAEAKRHKVTIKEGGGFLGRMKEAVGIGEGSRKESQTQGQTGGQVHPS
jgi:HSP20 family protein